jgi:hypothetical protein
VDPAYYEELIRGVVGGRKLIVCADVLAGAHVQGKAFSKLGAKKPFLVSGTLGTGELPTGSDAEWILLDTAGTTMMDGIRRFEHALLHPTPELLAALDRYDPDREAIVIGTIFMRSGAYWGRRSYGTRRPAWEALEDKMVIDEVLDDAGIERAPREIVAVATGDMQRAHARLDRGLGCAVAGDAREGWWGGAEFLRWARSSDDVESVASFFADHCDRVRMMPFLEGVPCSIHGLVLEDTALAFRPVELQTLRRPGLSKLQYAGTATYWDPPDADRDAMRDAARRLGTHLRERVGYLGAFTLDGVMTSEGFRPTEVNARVGAGLTPQIAAAGVDIPFLSRMITEAEPVDLRPAELEAFVVERADADRRGACYSVIDLAIDSSTEHAVSTDDLDGTIALGPSGVGGFVSYRPDTSLVPKGPSFAPTAVRAFAYTDEVYGTGLGPLEAAIDVRR